MTPRLSLLRTDPLHQLLCLREMLSHCRQRLIDERFELARGAALHALELSNVVSVFLDHRVDVLAVELRAASGVELVRHARLFRRRCGVERHVGLLCDVTQIVECVRVIAFKQWTADLSVPRVFTCSADLQVRDRSHAAREPNTTQRLGWMPSWHRRSESALVVRRVKCLRVLFLLDLRTHPSTGDENVASAAPGS